MEEIPIMLYLAVTRMPTEFPIAGVVSALLTFGARQSSVEYIKLLLFNIPSSGELLLREIICTTANLAVYEKKVTPESTTSSLFEVLTFFNRSAPSMYFHAEGSFRGYSPVGRGVTLAFLLCTYATCEPQLVARLAARTHGKLLGTNAKCTNCTSYSMYMTS
jgi:hypothetical protein